jgi:cytidylate kinase
MPEIPVITVDGPSGSGKGTISRQIAYQLNWHFLDSGALYRLVALGALKKGIELDDEARLAEYARQLAVKFISDDPAIEPVILLDNQNVTSEIRTETCGNAASKVAALPAVREALLQRQRDFRQPPGLVADGRDMGTTVFPGAKLKIFLTASAEERAKRRHKQLKEKGIDVNLAALVKDIAERDERDGSRVSSPLKPAEDAVIVDTSSIGIDEVLAEVNMLISEMISNTN